MKSDGVIWLSEPFISLVIALAIDLIFGEYPSKVHPVVYMGSLGKFIDGRRERIRSRVALFSLGAVALASEVTLWVWLSTLTTSVSNTFLRVALSALILKSTFSVRSLYEHVRRCATDDESELRKNVSMIVSRDVKALDKPHLYSAALESLSENTSDGITGPLFYYLLFGLPGAVAYRVVNTYDALFGYRTEKYEWFGKLPARADDVLNLIPSRLTALFIALLSPKRALRYIRLYGGLKLNGTYPMSAFAGVLDVGFEKPGYYRFEGRLPELEDVKRGLRIFVKVVCLETVVFVTLVSVLK